MAEPVGKPCECIFDFEKYYVDLVIGERIEAEKVKLAEIEEILSKMPPESKERYEGARDGFKFFIRDLETVRDRFKAMPGCKKES